MGEPLRRSVDEVTRRDSRGYAQPPSTAHPQDHWDEEDAGVYLAKAWDSTTKAASATAEQLKRQAVIPFLRWALSAIGQPPAPVPGLALAPAPALPQRVSEISRSEAERTEVQREMMLLLRCKELERRLAEEQKKLRSKTAEEEERSTVLEEKVKALQGTMAEIEKKEKEVESLLEGEAKRSQDMRVQLQGIEKQRAESVAQLHNTIREKCHLIARFQEEARISLTRLVPPSSSSFIPRRVSK